MNEMLFAAWNALCNIPLTDKIALVVTLLTALSAWFAQQAAAQARRANEIAVRSSLRAERLALFRSMCDFLHYCSTYHTLVCQEMVEGGQELVRRMDEFKWEVRHHQLLNMEQVHRIITDALTHAWNLQRLVDRLSEPDPKPIDPTCANIDENISKHIEWFSDQEKKLSQAFEPYM